MFQKLQRLLVEVTGKNRLFFSHEAILPCGSWRANPKGLNFKAAYWGQFALSAGMPFVLFQETLEKTHFQAPEHVKLHGPFS